MYKKICCILKCKKTAWIVLSLVGGGGIYLLLAIWMFSSQGITSDYSNLILEADDICRGNILLNGWILTGISFITTDLLYFVIGVIFCGVSERAYIIAIALMVTAMFGAAIGLISVREKKHKLQLKELFIFLSIAGIPTAFALSVLRAHTAVITWVFLEIYITYKLINKQYKKELWLFSLLIVLIIMGTMGDAVSLLLGAIPMLLVCGYLTCVVGGVNSKGLAKLFCIILFAVVLGMIFDKLYFYISSANKNDFLGRKKFEPIEHWGSKLVLWLQAILMMVGADFFAKPLISINTIFYFVNTVILILGVYIIIRNTIFFLKKQKYDYVTFILGCGFIIVSVVFILTDIGTDLLSARYIAYAPAMLAIIVIRYLNEIENRKFYCFIIILSLLSLIGKVTDVIKLNPSPALAQKELAKYLEDNNLENGYSSFWNASSVTVLSKNNVKVRAIQKLDRGFEKFAWFCKKEWYLEPAEFVVLDTEDSGFNVNSENVLGFWGAPKDIKLCGKYEIWCYDTDISDLLVNGLEDSRLYAFELYNNGHIKREGDLWKILPKGELWGPYENLSKGVYEVTYSGYGMENIEYDVYSTSLNRLFPVFVEKQSNNCIKYKVSLDVNVEDIEFRTHNNSATDMYLDNISITKIE